jgi:multiple sugar transport system ATP-binding protein
VAIGGRVVNGVPPKSRDIAMVFQNYALYPHMSVVENMSFSLRLRRAAPEEIRRRVGGSAAILGLEALLGRYPRQLSGGQRQRVAMGRAIVRDPQVFLFDEPLSNLDAKLRVHMRTEIKELHQRLRTTTIYVTHDQIEAMTLADLIVVLRDGRIEQIGTPLELYDRPANAFVASFIGSPAMNLLPGRIGDDGNSIVLDQGQRLAVGHQLAGTGNRLICGIRPEHFVLETTSEQATLDFEVKVVEPTGAETMVIGRCGNEPITAVFRERHALSPGERIRLRPSVIHVFDEQTERRISA